MATEERRPEAEAEDIVYKTKVVQFLGRSTPIVLQNDNGPCPLLAICNVLLLRNNINLSLDAAEVTLPKLLSLLAEKLIDSNSNVQDKDDGYVINQQQNIADAIDLLPRLGTGIDVNVQFRRINDFEFTRECAIFDLLDIGLCHGWIVDPQDVATSSVVGSKSYNALAGELVAFEARKSEVEHEKIRENDSVDFVAATTATLGVPSPSLSRGRSFDNCLYSLPEKKMKGKGDREEEEVLMMVLNMSRSDVSSPVGQSLLVDGHIPEGTELFDDHSSTTSEDSNIKQEVDDSEKSDPLDKIMPQECSVSNQCEEDVLQTEVVSVDNSSLLTSSSGVSALDQEIPAGSTYPSGLTGNANSEIVMPNEVPLVQSFDTHDRISVFNERAHLSEENPSSFLTCAEYLLKSQESEPQNKTGDSSTQYGLTNPVDSAVQNLSFQPSVNCPTNVIGSDVQNPSFQLSVNNGNELLAATKAVAGLGITEPIYEGEDCIHDSSLPKYDDQEPIYEGEIILCEQVHKDGGDSCSVDSNDKISEQQCHLIRNFLENTASQLTIYGLFCLQEGLKERELCVFFRNNHFSTMFKFNGELYLLVTDQGYINQPDLVWEKLNEVNGDTVFMTGNFKQFNADNQVNDSWNEQNAISSTADYLAALEGSVPPDSSLNSDLQLAIALQQQEFEQQPQHHNQQQQQQQQQQTSQQSSTIGRLRLVTGPQVSRNTNAPAKSETKIKEKCSIM
ncbi:hypothetical protein AXF42_Ash006381 [Apostasia shenzhenica]|uniref:MINDY deubiquitinase domain-containing protein n=1 Tax=Apostasia shenzhenica TaxID=1088818 RepID=A0A2I0AYW7_9ASPA|nr:hypothetical protein AXF42_Ash006381 [Apostasia shenzhenica]